MKIRKKIAIIFSSVIIIMTIAIGTYCIFNINNPQNKLEKNCKQAFEAINRKEYENAIKLLKQSQKLSKKCTDASNNELTDITLLINSLEHLKNDKKINKYVNSKIIDKN